MLIHDLFSVVKVQVIEYPGPRRCHSCDVPHFLDTVFVQFRFHIVFNKTWCLNINISLQTERAPRLWIEKRLNPFGKFLPLAIIADTFRYTIANRVLKGSTGVLTLHTAVSIHRSIE